MFDIQWEHLFNLELAIESFPFLMEGFGITLFIAVVSIFFTLIISIIVGIIRYSSNNIFTKLFDLYVSIMRGVPLMVFLFIIYYGLPVLNIQITNPVAAAILGISLNQGAYASEIIRSALASVPKEQWEAGQTLQMSNFQIYRKVILPQAVRIAIPPYFNVFMDVIKGTSLASTVTVKDMFYNSRIVAGRTFDSMTMYIFVAIVYWLLSLILTYIQSRLEKRTSKYVKK